MVKKQNGLRGLRFGIRKGMVIKMKMKVSVSERVFNVFNILLLSGLTLITLYPFLYVLFGSLSEPSELMKTSGLLVKPAGFSVMGYTTVLANEEILSGYANTIYYVILGTACSVLTSALLAFTLSRPYLKYKSVIMIMMVITMFFNGGLIPTFLVVKGVGLYNSRWALILPTLLSTYNVIVLKSAFEGIPHSIEESARVDGANSMTVLFRLIIPLSKAAIAVQVLFYGVGIWNAWFNAMIYLKDRTLYPVQLILREILLESSGGDMTTGAQVVDKVGLSDVIKYATVIITTVPVLCVYPFLQKYFVKGVMIGAVKG